MGIKLTAQSVLDCARAGLPAEIVSAPLFGATAPVTLAGALVQHTAENLSCQCMEKLVVDDEVCGMARRLARGIEPRDAVLAEELFGDLSQGDHFLTSPSTLRWLREEITFPSPVIDRQARGHATESGERGLLLRARQRMEELLARHVPRTLADDVRRHLSEVLWDDARRYGINRLPCFDGP